MKFKLNKTMSTLLKLPIDEMTGIESFLQDRKTAKDAFNTEFSALKKRMNAAKKENDLKVLFRISLNETIVFLGEQTLSNLFSNIEKEYPVSGLFLREIQIRHNEYLGDTFGYDNSIDIKFIFNVESFNNNPFSRFSFDRLSFNDDKNRLTDNSMGVCLDPTFADPEKYSAVRDALKDIQQKIKEYEPKEPEKKA